MTAVRAGDLDLLSKVMPGLEFSDPARRDFLGANGRDVQAAPGSGKTTLLVARLCLIAEHWVDTKRGVCVLSHTNVARDEVHSRLARQPRGQALLSHPHFIGTMTAFIHQFLAMPHLRGLGIGVRMVDDDAFIAEAVKEMWRSPIIRTWAEKRRDPESIAASLALDPENMRIFDRGLLPKSGRVRDGLERIRERMTGRGIFLYSDMVSIARLAFARCPLLSARLSQRFPVVFVDEAQDTSADHERLIREIFPANLVQWIGDSNQNIFGGAESLWMPAEGYLDLGGSKRFGPRTAAFASRLTMVRAQEIVGEGGPDVLHSIFLFDRATVGQVIPAYCRRLAETGQFTKASAVWAVAARHKAPDQARRSWPNCIGDYWPEYAHPKPQGSHAGTLLGVLMECRIRTALSGSPQEAVNAFGNALSRLLAATGVSHEARTQGLLWQWLESAAPGSRLALRGFLKSSLTTDLPSDAEEWARFVAPVLDTVEALTGNRPALTGFFAFEGQAPRIGEQRNLYVCEDSSTQLAVKVGTIHSIKGQTHDATLILETNEGQKMDVAEAIATAFLGGAQPSGKQMTKALMNVFVGATRPRYALCLATRREAVDARLERAIEAAGWIVHDLTVLGSIVEEQ